MVNGKEYYCFRGANGRENATKLRRGVGMGHRGEQSRLLIYNLEHLSGHPAPTLRKGKPVGLLP